VLKLGWFGVPHAHGAGAHTVTVHVSGGEAVRYVNFCSFFRAMLRLSNASDCNPHIVRYHFPLFHALLV
jgi:hypothetical protein